MTFDRSDGFFMSSLHYVVLYKQYIIYFSRDNIAKGLILRKLYLVKGCVVTALVKLNGIPSKLF